MVSRNRGFTLIELLVVIAIIAILAAILFPVFATARQSARGASSQSNLKQISLGVLMYVQDYDETFPMTQTWGRGAVCWGSCSNGQWSSWTFDVAPYIKTAAIFADPLSGPMAKDAWTQLILTDYGYNYTTLSPSKGTTTPWQYAGTAISAINFPASTVMVAGRFGSRDTGSWWYGAGTLVSEGTAEAPVCSPIPAWCFSDWAPNGNYSMLSEEAGLYTGGVSLRKSIQCNLAYTDGHVKFVAPGAGASGTNWFRGILAGAVAIRDANAYQWQLMP